jgi:hypothetical protein
MVRPPFAKYAGPGAEVDGSAQNVVVVPICVSLCIYQQNSHERADRVTPGHQRKHPNVPEKAIETFWKLWGDPWDLNKSRPNMGKCSFLKDSIVLEENLEVRQEKRGVPVLCILVGEGKMVSTVSVWIKGPGTVGRERIIKSEEWEIGIQINLIVSINSLATMVDQLI